MLLNVLLGLLIIGFTAVIQAIGTNYWLKLFISAQKRLSIDEFKKKEMIGYAPSGKIRVWSTDTGEVLHIFELPAADVSSVAWSRDNRMLAAA